MQQGSTLIEVLIALLILTAGLLALQLWLLRGIGELGSAVREQHAQRLLADSGERLALLPASALSALPGTAATCDSASICTPGELLSAGIADWQQRAADELPGGTVAVLRESQLGIQGARVAVRWQGPGNATRLLSNWYPCGVSS